MLKTSMYNTVGFHSGKSTTIRKEKWSVVARGWGQGEGSGADRTRLIWQNSDLYTKKGEFMHIIQFFKKCEKNKTKMYTGFKIICIYVWVSRP